MIWPTLLVVLAALTNTQIASTETKLPRTKPNLFDPVLSANAYVGHLKENERTVALQPRLAASDADSGNTANGKICGYDLSLHKHDDNAGELTETIPFAVELLDGQPVLQRKANVDPLDCEVKQTHRLFIRAFDCAPADKRRYSERSPLTITVDDVNEYAPVFTHDQYLFKLHQDETCDASSCRVEATDDDCGNADHRVCGYEIVTANVPFTIDSQGSISITQKLTAEQYDFDVVAIDCFPASDNSRKVSQPARVTFKIIKACKPLITDNASAQLLVQADRIHLFDGVNVNTCDGTCVVEDIVGTVELHSNGLDSGCNAEQCSSTEREYILLEKDGDANEAPRSKITTFNGYNQALIVNHSRFSGHFNNEFTIQMWMKHSNDASSTNNNNNDKEHVFCKSDEKLKNRHHTALFIQNNYLKLLIRKGPLATSSPTKYASEWMWKVAEVNDNRWHSYKVVVNYPEKIDLYVDGRLVVPNKDNFRVVEDTPLSEISGTEDTIFALGACWHARASRLVQHFHGQLSGLAIEQKDEVQRSSDCIRDCHQYLDIADVEKETGMEFMSNVNRSMWILRTDARDSYEKLLKHLVYRNTFQPLGPYGQRTVSINTRVKCYGEVNTFELPAFTRQLSIVAPRIPTKIELKSDTSRLITERTINQGIYLFRNMSIYTNAIKRNQGDISDCNLRAQPALSKSEQLIIPQDDNIDHMITREGAVLTGVGSIDAYQSLLRQVAYISKAPVTYTDRSFTISCTGVYERVLTNEIRVRIHVEKQMAAPVPVAAIASNKLVVDNDAMADNLVDADISPIKRSVSDLPVAVVVCVSIGLVGVLVLYLVVRMRSNTKYHHHPSTHTADDLHSQMEWEDDIGLNITVNPLDETKKSVAAANIHNVDQARDELAVGSSSDDDDDEYGNQGHNRNEYFSEEDDDYQKHARKVDHQLEWDDAAIEYGPKKV